MREPGHLADALMGVVLDGLLGRDPALLRTPAPATGAPADAAAGQHGRPGPVAAGRRPGFVEGGLVHRIDVLASGLPTA